MKDECTHGTAKPEDCEKCQYLAEEQMNCLPEPEKGKPGDWSMLLDYVRHLPDCEMLLSFSKFERQKPCSCGLDFILRNTVGKL